MHPRLKLCAFLLGACLILLGGLALQLFLSRTPRVTVEGTLVQVNAHTGHRNRGTDLVVLRADGRRQLVSAGGVDPHFTTGQRVRLEEQANVVRRCVFLDAAGWEQGRYDDNPFPPLLLFGPCGLILGWLGWRGYRQDMARVATAVRS